MERRNIFHAFMKVLMHASTVRFVLIMVEGLLVLSYM